MQMYLCTIYYVQLLLDDDECDRHPCGPNAECSNTPGSFICKCNNGYVRDGEDCTGKCFKQETGTM